MICNNCGKELKEGAKFCGHCGKEVNIERNIKSDTKNFEEEKKETKKIIKKTLKKIIVVVLVFLAIVAIISGIIVSIKRKTINNTQNSSGTFEENIEEEEIKKIPEDKKAIVTFVENGVETKEEREVDREKLLSCVNNVIINTSDELRGIGAGVIKYKLLLYYVEYDIIIDNKTTHKNEYGAIMHSNVVAQDLRSIYAKNYYYRLVTKFSNDNPMLQVVKMGDTTRNEQFILNDVVVSREEYFQDIEDSLTNVFGSSCRNIHIGGINAKDNEWVKSIFNTTEQNNEKEAEDEEVTANEDYEEMMNLYDENNSNNNSNTNSDVITNNNSVEKPEEYLAPLISTRDSHDSTYNQDYGYITIDINDYDYDDEVTVSVNGNQATRVYRTCYSYDYNLTVGENSFDISVTNKYGKTTSKKHTIKFEPSVPKISIMQQGNSYGFLDEPTIVADYNKLKNLDIKVTCNGKSGTITYNEYYNVSEQEEEGENTVVFTVTNKYGKTYTTSYTYTK